VYAVCTLTRAETAGVADQFAREHPEFEPIPLPLLREDAARLGLQGQPTLQLWPQDYHGNGMFVAQWRRREL
jgi:16S rRNA (cytosine967-C5)-methyltransferase